MERLSHTPNMANNFIMCVQITHRFQAFNVPARRNGYPRFTTQQCPTTQSDIATKTKSMLK